MRAANTLRTIVAAALICTAAAAQPTATDSPPQPSPTDESPGDAQLREASETLLGLVAQGRLQADRQEWSQAGQTYRQAFQVAVDISPADAECVLTHLRAMHRRQQALEPIDEARKQLKARPRDAELRKELIDLIIIGLGDFAAAAELVDDSIDETTGRLVALAASGQSVTDGGECLALARWHKALADRADGPVKCMLLRRVGWYCQQALRDGAGRDDSAAMLAEVVRQIQESDESGASLPRDVWIDLLTGPPLQEMPGSPAWRRSDTGSLVADGELRNESFGRFPIVIDGTCQVQVRFVGPEGWGALGVYVPAGDLVTGASAGSSQDVLAERIERSGFSRDGKIHTLTVGVTARQGGYALFADADGLPYLLCNQPARGIEQRLRGDQKIAAARDHFMLAGAGPNMEVLAVAFKLTSGRARWHDAATDTSARRRRISVLASQPWQWVTQVRPGDVVEMTATGQWSPGGPDMVGPAGDEGGWYALRGRLIDGERTFTIGERTLVVATEDDVLKMEMDDANKADNHGAVDVTVTVISDLWPGDGPVEDGFAGQAGRRDAAEDLEILFGRRIHQAGRTADIDDDISLSKQLLAAAQVVEYEPLAALLADNARQLALADRTGYHVAIEAIKLLLALDSGRYEQHRPTLIMLARKRHMNAYPAIKSAAAAELFHVLVDAAEQHAETGRWDLASQLYGQAQAIEDNALADYAEHLAARAEHAAQREAMFRKKVQLDEQLARRPASADVRSRLILLNIVELADADAAADLVNDDVAPALAEGVRLARRGPDRLDVDEVIRLAQWYMALAEGDDLTDWAKSSLLDRAWRCCEVALSADDPDSGTAEAAHKMLSRISQAIAEGDLPGADPMRRGEWVHLLGRVDLNDGDSPSWRRRGSSLVYYRLRDKDTPKSVHLPVLPRGDYDLRLDWLQIRSGGAPVVLCPLTNPEDGSTWTVAVPVLAEGQSVTSRRAVLTEIRVRHVDDQAVVDVITDGKEQFHNVLAPGQSWHADAKPPSYAPSLGMIGGGRTLIIHSARLRMLTGHARPLPQRLRKRWGRFQVHAASPWQDMLLVRQGDRVTISAEGAWSAYFRGGQDYITTPDGRGNETDGRWGYLAGRVGQGKEFFVGSNLSFTAESDGMLQLQMHDGTDGLDNNNGYLTVTVQIRPGED